MTHTFGLVDETRFWSRQLMEHMDILAAATEDVALKNRAVALRDRWNRYIAYLATETAVTTDNANAHREYLAAVDRLVAQYNTGVIATEDTSRQAQLLAEATRIKAEQARVAQEQALIAQEQARLTARLGTTQHTATHQRHAQITADHQRRLATPDPINRAELINKHLQIAVEQEQVAREQHAIADDHARAAANTAILALTVSERDAIPRDRITSIQHEGITRQHQTILRSHQTIVPVVVPRTGDQLVQALDALNRQYQARVAQHHMAVQQNISQLLLDTIAFKRDLLSASQARWVGWAYPSLIQHMLREAQYYQAKLEGRALRPADEIAFWQQIQKEHAEIIAHLTDPVHSDLVYRIKTMVRDFDTANRLLASYPANVREYLLLGIAQQQVGQVNTLATSYRGANLRSIIPPALLDHISREGARGTAVLQNIQKFVQRV